MKTRTLYEWKIEEVNADGDIVDCRFADCLTDFAPYDWDPQADDAVRVELCLVRDVWDDADEDLVDRLHAYPNTAGRLTYHEEPARAVPRTHQLAYNRHRHRKP